MRLLKLDKSAARTRVIIDLVFFIAALVLSYYFVKFRFNWNSENPRAALYMLMHGVAAKPFQYRMLVPWIINIIISIKLPLPIFNNIFFLFVLAELLSVFLLVVSYRYFLSFFFKDKVINSLLSLTLFYVLPFNFILGLTTPFYPSDIPSLLFFTLGLILLYKKKWILYYPLFGIAAFNRETTIFLTFIYLFTAIKRSKFASVVFHCFCQFIIWFAIKSFLYQLYINNPGPLLSEFTHYYNNVTHFSTNLDFLKHLYSCCFLASSMGYIWILVVFYFWVIPDEFVKRSLLVCFPFFIVLMFIGNIYEMRVYSELIPIMLTAFLLIIKEFVKRKRI